MAPWNPDNSESLYAIPWSAANNANGWIEPTTHCQLTCPGCYRGLSRQGHRPAHMKLDELKAQVDFLVAKRNVQTISIAGGEPLLYPDLEELIAYIRAREIKLVVLTNGLLLDETRLTQLKNLGVDCFLLHLDKFQGRTANPDETEVNRLRQTFCDLFRKVKEVQLGFIMPISHATLGDMDVLAPFFKQNADVIEMVTFTIQREGIQLRNPAAAREAKDIRPILAKVKKTLGLTYCAYIPKLYSDDIGWIYASTLYRNGKPWKPITPAMFRTIQDTHFKTRGKYQFVPFQKRSGRLTDQGIFTQTVIVVNLPVLTDRGWDLCRGCPDAMVYNGRLVPSCLLEQIKRGQDIRVFEDNAG